MTYEILPQSQLSILEEAKEHVLSELNKAFNNIEIEGTKHPLTQQLFDASKTDHENYVTLHNLQRRTIKFFDDLLVTKQTYINLVKFPELFNAFAVGLRTTESPLYNCINMTGNFRPNMINKALLTVLTDTL